MVFGYSTIRLIVCVYRYSAAEPHLADARPWARGGQLIVLRGHFEKAAFSEGPYVLMEVDATLGLVSLSTNIYCDKMEEISDLKIFLNVSASH